MDGDDKNTTTKGWMKERKKERMVKTWKKDLRKDGLLKFIIYEEGEEEVHMLLSTKPLRRDNLLKICQDLH